MLSKKMAFSLTSLITILALAFVVTPAMAGEFGVSLYQVQDADGTDATDTLMDVSHADGLQVSPPATDTAIRVTVKFDRAVVLAATSVSIGGYDKDGVLLPAVALAATTPIAPTTAAKMITLSITLGAGGDAAAMVRKVTLKIAKGIGSADPFNDDTSKEFKTDIHLLPADRAGGPDVWKIALVGEPFSPITTATFQTHILLSEEPMGGFNKDHIEVSDADVASVVKLVSPMTAPTGLIQRDTTAVPGEITPTDRSTAGLATWRDDNIHLYLVTFNTVEGEKDVKIKIKNFAGNERPTGALTQQTYVRAADSQLTEGRDLLTVKTKRAVTTIKAAGVAETHLPHGDAPEIPADGFYLLVRDAGDSGIIISGVGDENDSTKQTPAQLKYNARAGGSVNLEQFLANGGTIDLTTTETGIAMGDVVISEIMWGSNLAVADSSLSQWIEIHNTTASKIVVAEKEWTLKFYGANEVLPTTGYIDRVGTRDEASGTFWSLAGKGQSGRTDLDPTGVAAASSFPIISMQRARAADGTYADGTMASNWSQSVGPAVNFAVGIEGSRIGTPGASPVTLPQPTPPADPPVVVTIPAAVLGDILVTEIMVDTGNGRLPQWIELANFSGKEVTLDGWSVEITNHADDADVERKVSIDLTGQTLDVREGANGTRGEALLLAAWGGRSSGNLSDRVLNVSSQLNKTGRYTLLSSMGFIIELLPPLDSGIVVASDEAGNLRAEEAWEIEMDETGRSSLIRKFAAGVAADGEEADGWTLASSTSLLQAPASWYGSDEDAGTPGVIGGGPLPVELSHFRPARDKATGAVVITWATQSELNNAGFFIKRSQQRNGEFKVINATMIAGAGTTSEKQFYTYTDTTAQPNVVYYYQIEDVSLDGNRQTLTRGIRLKGHIGAAGKLTSTWGELKSSNE